MAGCAAKICNKRDRERLVMRMKIVCLITLILLVGVRLFGETNYVRCKIIRGDPTSHDPLLATWWLTWSNANPGMRYYMYYTPAGPAGPWMGFGSVSSGKSVFDASRVFGVRVESGELVPLGRDEVVFGMLEDGGIYGSGAIPFFMVGLVSASYRQYNSTVTPGPMNSNNFISTNGLAGVLVNLSGTSDGYAQARILNPKYQSYSAETNAFHGMINVPGGACWFLYVKCDDGCAIYLDGDPVHNTTEQNQSWENDAALTFIGKLSSGFHQILLVYVNRIYAGYPDKDGVTLYILGQWDGSTDPVVGPDDIFWYVNPDVDFVYKLVAPENGTTVWTVSPNLQIVGNNDDRQELYVRPLRQSANYDADWVQVEWTDPCSYLRNRNRLDVSILKPSRLQVLGNATGYTVFGGTTYLANTNVCRVVDQFGQTWRNTCLYSSDSVILPPSPESGYMLLPDIENGSVVSGLLYDWVGIHSIVGIFTVRQNRTVRVHKLGGEYGAPVADEASVYYHSTGAGNTIVRATYSP